MKKTKEYALAYILDKLIYSGINLNGSTSYYSIHDREYVGPWDEWSGYGFPFIEHGKSGAYVRVPEALRYIQQELERLALIKVTS
jgi:hypothetical protein